MLSKSDEQIFHQKIHNFTEFAVKFNLCHAEQTWESLHKQLVESTALEGQPPSWKRCMDYHSAPSLNLRYVLIFLLALV